MNRFYDKRPKEPRKRMHYNRRGIAKQSFETKELALHFIHRYRLSEYSEYLCHECGYWHIGRKQE